MKCRPHRWNIEDWLPLLKANPGRGNLPGDLVPELELWSGSSGSRHDPKHEGEHCRRDRQAVL